MSKDTFEEIIKKCIDSSKTLVAVKESIVEGLLNEGEQINIDDLARVIDMTNDRILRLFILKKLIAEYGLVEHEKEIIIKELELIYYSKSDKAASRDWRPSIIGETK